MDGEDLVVEIRRQHPAFRLCQLQPHQHGQHAAEQQEDERRDDVPPPDHLVIHHGQRADHSGWRAPDAGQAPLQRIRLAVYPRRFQRSVEAADEGCGSTANRPYPTSIKHCSRRRRGCQSHSDKPSRIVPEGQETLEATVNRLPISASNAPWMPVQVLRKEITRPEELKSTTMVLPTRQPRTTPGARPMKCPEAAALSGSLLP
jgi:hypothetical protein